MSRYTFADLLTSASDPGTSRLSAINMANVLGIQQQELATIAGVHRNTLRTHPDSPRLQAALSDIVCVVSAAVRVEPDFERALFLLKHQPIAVFRHKTILQLIQEGRATDAVDYLDSISGGFVG
ncbi:DNA-binding protein [Caballeronia sp. J97]|uniref:DNA-binding protein n=1 Tax=Caballeronia sp. J97 TaxID=2805429 RepID=UPI002AB0A245|nr:DNA-binding protein [Caballeronia sp. J97]